MAVSTNLGSFFGAYPCNKSPTKSRSGPLSFEKLPYASASTRGYLHKGRNTAASVEHAAVKEHSMDDPFFEPSMLQRKKGQF